MASEQKRRCQTLNRIQPEADVYDVADSRRLLHALGFYSRIKPVRPVQNPCSRVEDRRVHWRKRFLDTVLEHGDGYVESFVDRFDVQPLHLLNHQSADRTEG